MLPFLSLISSGSGLNGVDILSSFDCFINTLSPTLILGLCSLHDCTWQHTHSFSLFSWHQFVWPLGKPDHTVIRGNVDLSLHPFSKSEGDFAVVLWGVALYCRRKVNNSCLQFFSWMTAVLTAFSSVFISLSASPLALGHTGVTNLWVTVKGKTDTNALPLF